MKKNYKDYTKTLLFCFFLGMFGVHRFIHKRYLSATIMLLTFGGFGIWYLIDLIIIMTKHFKDSKNRTITYKGKFKKNRTNIFVVTLAAIIILSVFKISNVTEEVNTINTNVSNSYINNPEIQVQTCDLSGFLTPNVKVDIGVDSLSINRIYYSYTNEYAQVVFIYAEELILQDDKIEEVKSSGRYCNDEAKVEGTQLANYDEGHIIADSLGAVSNAYNIVPQESNLNRNGEQAIMEEQLRNALANNQKVTEFSAQLTYPNQTTKTPSYYLYTFKIDGTDYKYEFANK